MQFSIAKNDLYKNDADAEDDLHGNGSDAADEEDLQIL